MLPDPVDDPWLYKLVPQKIYDWLGVSTKVREAQAEMANARIEVEKLEAKRAEHQKLIDEGDMRTWRGASRKGQIEDINEELLEANQKAADAEAVLARTVDNSRPHLVTDIGLIIKKHGFLPISTPKQLVKVPPNISAQTNQMGALLSAAAAGSSGGGGGTTVNNVTVAPSTSNSISSVNKSENTYGTVDPYTSAAGAYG